MELIWRGDRIAWDPAFSVGDPALDVERAELLDRLNDLCDAVAGGDGMETVRSRFDAFTAKSFTHFDHEERVLALAGYPDLSRHKALHNELSFQLDQLRADLDEGYVDGLRSDKIDSFKTWLASHMLVADRDYADWLERRRGKTETSPDAWTQDTAILAATAG